MTAQEQDSLLLVLCFCIPIPGSFILPMPLQARPTRLLPVSDYLISVNSGQNNNGGLLFTAITPQFADLVGLPRLATSE